MTEGHHADCAGAAQTDAGEVVVAEGAVLDLVEVVEDEVLDPGVPPAVVPQVGPVAASCGLAGAGQARGGCALPAALQRTQVVHVQPAQVGQVETAAGFGLVQCL